MRVIASFVSITLVLFACVLHSFYIDYEIDRPHYIISWPATDSQKDKLARYVAAGSYARTNAERTDVETRYRATLNAREVLFGAVPASLLGKESPSLIQKSFWLGLALPIFLVISSICILLLGQKKGGFGQGANSEPILSVNETAADGASTSQLPGKLGEPEISLRPNTITTSESIAPKAKDTALADLLREFLDPDFPVSTGNGKADDPLIITADRDYVGIEYAVVRHALGMVREDYKLNRQQIHNQNGQMIDELVFDVKPSGASEWAGQRRFFFDITAGYGIK